MMSISLGLAKANRLLELAAKFSMFALSNERVDAALMQSMFDC